MQNPAAPREIVRFEHVSKQFPGTLANDDICLSIERGEVFALVGENGAGKTTLMNQLYGLERPTLGEIYLQGQAAGAQHNPQNAMRLGVSMVHQHFKLVPSFTVAQNVLLGCEPRRGMFYDEEEARRRVRALSEEYGLKVEPGDITRDLSVGLQQRVEILKALRSGADVLILDEPTAVLTPQEAEELFRVIRRIVDEKGMTVILITHKLPEVMRISDRVGVMRRGRLMRVLNTGDTSERELASLMVGREVVFDDERSQASAGQAQLVIEGLTALSDRRLPALRGVDITVRAGEIVGVCGVEGNGQTELAECVAGMRAATGGTVTLCGRNVTGLPPREVRQAGLSYIPEDRLAVGSDARATVTDNLLLGRQRERAFSRFRLHLRRGAARRHAERLSRDYDIRSAGVDSLAGDLSGGNLQKVVVAREFSFGTPVLLVCQPTRGVDIGASEFIHERILKKRDEGCAILLISADLDELFRLSDRLVTLYEGRITGRFDAKDVSREEIGFRMTGERGDAE